MSDASANVAGGAVELASLGEAFGLAVELFNTSNENMIEHLGRLEDAMERAGTRSDEQMAYYVAQAGNHRPEHARKKKLSMTCDAWAANNASWRPGGGLMKNCSTSPPRTHRCGRSLATLWRAWWVFLCSYWVGTGIPGPARPVTQGGGEQAPGREQRRMALEEALADLLATGRVTPARWPYRHQWQRAVLAEFRPAAARGRALLRTLVGPLRVYLGEREELLMVSGFTDDLPIQKGNSRFADNWELSAQRALTVTRAW